MNNQFNVTIVAPNHKLPTKEWLVAFLAREFDQRYSRSNPPVYGFESCHAAFRAKLSRSIFGLDVKNARALLALFFNRHVLNSLLVGRGTLAW